MFCALADVDPADESIDYQFLKDHLKNKKSRPESIGYACDARNDVSSPADMVRLSTLIHEGHGLTEQSREGVMKILKDQNFNTIITAACRWTPASRPRTRPVACAASATTPGWSTPQPSTTPSRS